MRCAYVLFMGGALWSCNVVSGVSDFEVTPIVDSPAPFTGAPLWGRAYGETLSSVGRSVVCDAAGNIFVGGSTSGKLSFGGHVLPHSESWDGVVAKLDPDGVHLWSTSFIGRGDQLVESLAVTPDGDVVVVGTFGTEILIDGARHPAAGDSIDEESFVARLDGATGSREWSKSFGGPTPQRGRAVAVDVTGDIMVAGDFFDVINIDGALLPGAAPTLGTSDVFVVRLAADGTHVAHGAIGDAKDDNARSLAFNAAGQMFLGMEFEGTLNLAGPITAVGHDALVIKFGEPAAPGVLWLAHITGPGVQRVTGLAADATGGVVVSGTFAGSATIGGSTAVAYRDSAFATALDAGGDVVWLRHFLGATRAAGGGTIALDAWGNAVLTGSFLGWMTVEADMLFAERTIAGEPSRDVFLLKLDPAGNALWSSSFGSMGDDAGTGVATDPLGNAVMVGELDGSATLGEQPIATSADVAFLVAKFSP